MGCGSSKSDEDGILDYSSRKKCSCCRCARRTAARGCLKWFDCCCCCYDLPTPISESDVDSVIKPVRQADIESESFPDPIKENKRVYKNQLTYDPSVQIKIISFSGIEKIHEIAHVGNAHELGLKNFNPLDCIEGFEDETDVTFEESLQPIIQDNPQLRSYIDEAKAKCNKSSQHGLTVDESAAIYIYSMEVSDGVCQLLYKDWSLNDKSAMKKWLKFLKLFKNALDKLPDADKACQIVSCDESIQDMLENSSSSIYTALSKAKPEEPDISKHRDLAKNGKLCSVTYLCAGGKDVTDYTPGKKISVILWPGLKVSSIMTEIRDFCGYIYFHLKPRSESPVRKPEPIPIEQGWIDHPKVSRRKPSIDIFVPIHISPMPKEVITKKTYERHFFCSRPGCRNSCSADHSRNHCRGFSFVHHECSHHCSPQNRCFVCKKHVTKLHQCNQCNWRLCENCSFKQITIIRLENK
ncbi:unnamed protein product [Adineta ricciae]|uniref:Uncharacterized protein n=1 Tax=Adineta ricciae TaxID=249248 RepID=A0A815H9C6_ADIRI|nr:unnamed protein product [Adineta ricciae]